MNETTINDLIPCPWCGIKPTVTLNFSDVDLIAISCENMKCPVKPSIVVYNFAEAIDRWNTRATPLNPPLTLEQLKDRVGKPVFILTGELSFNE